MSDDPKAERIRAKISASQARSRGEGAPRKKTATRSGPAKAGKDERGFVTRAIQDHPLAVLAGGVALGAIAAALMPRSVARKLGNRALGIAAVAGEMGSLYGGKAWDAASESARAGQDKLEDLSGAIAGQGAEARRKAAEFGVSAAKRALEFAETAARNAREARGSALKTIGELSERARS